MFAKKKASTGVKNGVSYLNGQIKFQGVSLNVYSYFWGRRKPFQAQATPDSFSSRKAQWDVIDTPGHAFDHKSFLNRENGQLFTGDLFVSEKTKVVLAEESIPEIIRSLERVLTYDFEDVFCSHAGYVEDGRAALQRKRDYLLSIQDDVFALHKEGNSAEAIRQKLFPKKYPIVKFSGGEWDSRHIVTSILNECQMLNR
ncbi:hypothetical protein [Cytobacillus sp. BC1816]|uniref:hypothetical protein n=1 Tax=Cytobacillus sp. BC1816 TaxID=3440154 RepID=UPI003F5194C4